MKRQLIVSALVFAVFAASGVAYRLATASDHDDGETDIKARALNLTDHYMFKAPDDSNAMVLVMYVNPRSLPGYQYLLSTQARYEFHVSRPAAKNSPASTSDNVVLRFEAGAADASGVQPVTFTVLKDGAVIGSHSGATTSMPNSRLNTTAKLTTNTATVGADTFTYFIGSRADTFHFDVIRYFQVRNFAARRFFGAGTAGEPIPPAYLEANCKGQAFLANILNPGSDAVDGDGVNLFNPPSCAPDFTKNYNVTAIVLKAPITAFRSAGGAENIFDSWSTISIPQ